MLARVKASRDANSRMRRPWITRRNSNLASTRNKESASRRSNVRSGCRLPGCGSTEAQIGNDVRFRYLAIPHDHNRVSQVFDHLQIMSDEQVRLWAGSLQVCK